MMVDLEYKGVTLTCQVRDSLYDGYDTLSHKRFPAGTTVAYRAAKDLTPDQKAVLFPSGKVYAVTIMYPVTCKAVKVTERSSGAPGASGGISKADPYTKSIMVSSKVEPIVGQKRAARPYTPSLHQQAILSALLDTESHILIDAKAGSGKTETLIWLIDNLYDLGLLDVYSVVFLAFNAHIRDELNEKLRGTGVPAYTSHAFGYMLLKKRFGQGVVLKKGKWLTRTRFLQLVCRMNGLTTSKEGLKAGRQEEEYKAVGAVVDLVDKAKNWAIFPEWVNNEWMFTPESREKIGWMVKKYEIEVPKSVDEGTLVDWACLVLGMSIPRPGEGLTEIEFDDMIFLPIVPELGVQFPKHDFILTDETQDWNRAQTIMLERLIEAGKTT